MPHFGDGSKLKLDTCHPNLVRVANVAIVQYDFKVIYGHRGKTVQNQLYRERRSKVKFPDSKHNIYPSEAIDIAPWPIDWNDEKRFYYLAGLFKGIAKTMGIHLIWGGDWNDNNIFKREPGDVLDDLGHFQLKHSNY
jgi:peptidoglycan L-alanyl-D-glutamate endopeptidase CwlK